MTFFGFGASDTQCSESETGESSCSEDSSWPTIPDFVGFKSRKSRKPRCLSSSSAVFLTLEPGASPVFTDTAARSAADATRSPIHDIVVRELWKNDPRKVRMALGRLVDIYYGDRDSRQFIRIGGPIAVVNAMLRHSNSVGVQTDGCRALFAVAQSCSSVREVLAEIDGIRAVVAAMKRWSNRSHLQTCACAALSAIAYKSRKNKKLIADADGISAIVWAMNACPDDVNLQFYGCDTLDRLSTMSEDMRRRIVDDGGLSSIAAAAERHFSVAFVRERACRVLSRLSTKRQDSDPYTTMIPQVSESSRDFSGEYSSSLIGARWDAL